MRLMVLLRWFVLVLGVTWLVVLGIQVLRGDSPDQMGQQLAIALLFAGSGIYGLVRGDDDNRDKRTPGPF